MTMVPIIVGILGFTISGILLYFLVKLSVAYFRKRLEDQAAIDTKKIETDNEIK